VQLNPLNHSKHCRCISWPVTLDKGSDTPSPHWLMGKLCWPNPTFSHIWNRPGGQVWHSDSSHLPRVGMNWPYARIKEVGGKLVTHHRLYYYLQIERFFEFQGEIPSLTFQNIWICVWQFIHNIWAGRDIGQICRSNSPMYDNTDKAISKVPAMKVHASMQ